MIVSMGFVSFFLSCHLILSLVVSRVVSLLVCRLVYHPCVIVSSLLSFFMGFLSLVRSHAVCHCVSLSCHQNHSASLVQKCFSANFFSHFASNHFLDTLTCRARFHSIRFNSIHYNPVKSTENYRFHSLNSFSLLSPYEMASITKALCVQCWTAIFKKASKVNITPNWHYLNMTALSLLSGVMPSHFLAFIS